MAKEHNVEYWRDEIQDLEIGVEVSYEFLAEQEAAYFEGAVKGLREDSEHPGSRRASFERAKESATCLAGRLIAARACLAQAEADEADDKRARHIEFIETAQGEMREYQRKALDSLKPFIEALQAFEIEAEEIDYFADNQMRRLMHNRYGPVAHFMTAMLRKEVPLLIEPLARCASNSKEAAEWCEGKTLEGVSDDYLTGFVKRNPIDWGSF